MYVYNYYIFLRIVHFMSPNLESALLDANMASSASLKIDLLEVTFFFIPLLPVRYIYCSRQILGSWFLIQYFDCVFQLES